MHLPCLVVFLNDNRIKIQSIFKSNQEMISISTKCLLSDPDNFVCICYKPVLFEFNKILLKFGYVSLLDEFVMIKLCMQVLVC